MASEKVWSLSVNIDGEETDNYVESEEEMECKELSYTYRPWQSS